MGQSVSVGYLSEKEAADFARAVWDQAHGLLRQHTAKYVSLTNAQIQRIKVFGHWANYLEQRALPWDVYGINPAATRPELPQPPYPLFGPISGDIPYPPQYKGAEGVMYDLIYFEEYFNAGLVSAAQAADLWYTKGLGYALYQMATGRVGSGAAYLAILALPYGHVLGSTLWLYNEANTIYEDVKTGTVTWEAHIGTASSLLLYGAGVLQQRAKLNSLQADPGLGINEGKPSPAITSRIGNGDKAYKVISQGAAAKITVMGKQYDARPVKVNYAIVGPTKADPNNKLAFLTGDFYMIRTASGKERFFLTDAKRTPAFFMGDQGYHVWKHLTENNAGQDTGMPSLQQAFAGRPTYLAPLRDLYRTMRSPDANLTQVAADYTNIMNKPIHAPEFKLNQVRGLYRWGKSDVEANYFMRVPCDSGGVKIDYPVRVSIDWQTKKLSNVMVLPPIGSNAQLALPGPVRKDIMTWLDMPASFTNFPSYQFFLKEDSSGQ
jgi:hypothetical protein